ncbi:MAG TPA: serine/threonine-protein kinase [Vicinamibacterales bacterium]|jgi:serine/threonine-protein kinase
MPTSFSPEEWSRIEAILDDVLELEPAARAAAIARACGSDARLRQHIESLVAADAGASAFLETPAAEYAAGLVRAAGGSDPILRQEEPGDAIGPYRLIREIGHGGMGRVFLADRADGQFEQQVALKLVRSGPFGQEILQRFLRERQILARLQHPNIARLLDGGVTRDGRPYFAMEYVVGEPITTYCDTHALSVSARLTLFTEVCDAVQYAHQNLVVHRDLKPTNTLVTPDGQVKLLDFGIAKVLHESEEDDRFEATLTRVGTGPMTPEYAAPEQVRGEPVTTATDVYALGALAYEILTGRRPHRLSKLTAAEVERAIAERDVDRPSTAVAQSRASLDGEPTIDAIARARATDGHRLRRELKGDLDTIVMQALQKEPARRYASAGAFAEDVRKFLNRLPISARRDSFGYRSSKFVRRHAIGVTATILVLASLVAGLIGTAWQARVASREAAKAREVSRFLASLFEVADPARTKASDITALSLLERGAQRVETELAGQPDVQADMMLLLGRIYRELGEYDSAQRLLERALALRTAASGREHEQIPDAMSELARLWLDKGKPEEAERLQREALALRRNSRGPATPDVGENLRDLASVLTTRGKFDEAEKMLREALALHESYYGAEHEEIASDLTGLQSTLRARGQSEPAIAAARRALDMRLKLLGTDHLETATAMNNLAILLYEKWELVEAERLYRQVLEFDMRRLGELHPNTATVMNNLAFVLRDRGQYHEAERLYRTVLDLDRKLFGPEHPYVAQVMNNLAALLAMEGKYDEAEKLFRDSLAMFQRVLGTHWRIGTVQGGLAGVLSAKGDARAEQMYRDSLAYLEKLLPPQHPHFDPVLIGLGRYLTAHGKAAEAEPFLRRALGAREARHGANDPRTAEAQVRLGACLSALGRIDEALQLLTVGHARLREEPHFKAETHEAAQLLAHMSRSASR